MKEFVFNESFEIITCTVDENHLSINNIRETVQHLTVEYEEN